MHWFHLVLIGAVLAFTAICAVLDWRTRRIPNYLTVPMFLLGVALCTTQGGWHGLGYSLLGFATGFGLLLVLWFIGGGGGGDVKMMGALGAWLGWWHTLMLFIASGVATVFLVSGVLLYRAVVKEPAEKKKKKASRETKDDPFRVGRLMPYALPVTVGAWAVLFYAWKYHTLP